MDHRYHSSSTDTRNPPTWPSVPSHCCPVLVAIRLRKCLSSVTRRWSRACLCQRPVATMGHPLRSVTPRRLRLATLLRSTLSAANGQMGCATPVAAPLAGTTGRWASGTQLFYQREAFIILPSGQRSASAAAPQRGRLQPVCAQHGRVAQGVQVPRRRTAHGNMRQLLLEANSGRVTDRGKEG
jgi:hypothetical protein